MAERKQLSWNLFRFLLFAAAASLAAYIPFKYATQLHAIEGIYFYLFPLSSVVALAGILLAWKPVDAFRLPLWLKAATSAIAIGWIATGVVCIPSLAKTTMSAPALGLFATFHMVAQHVFLSLSVTFLLLVPHSFYAWFGKAVPAPEGEAAAEVAPSES